MKKGFTLIELLVVILIIGVLAAIALPQYRITVLKAKYTEMRTVTEHVARLIEMHYLETGENVTNFSNLTGDFPTGCEPVKYFENILKCQDDVVVRIGGYTSYPYDGGPNSVNGEIWLDKDADVSAYYHKYFRFRKGDSSYNIMPGMTTCVANTSRSKWQYRLCEAMGGAEIYKSASGVKVYEIS